MARRKSAPSKSKSQNALALLRADHKEVIALFEEYEKKSGRLDDAKRKTLAATICDELTVHATVEEEIFYPAIRAAFRAQEDTLDEAEVEHAGAKDLIAQIKAASPADDLFDAKVTVLGEYVRHHVREEHGMFAEIQKSRKVDFEALGEQLKARKEELKPEK